MSIQLFILVQNLRRLNWGSLCVGRLEVKRNIAIIEDHGAAEISFSLSFVMAKLKITPDKEMEQIHKRKKTQI